MVRTASTLVLTRLLSPDAFGIVGIINSIFFTIVLLTDLGFQSFVVRHERGDEKHFNDVLWTIHAARGIALTVLAVAAAPIVARVLGKPEVALPFAVASILFAIMGFASFSLMTALRNDGARKLSLLDLLTQVIQTIIAVLLAWWWRNAWALVASLIVQQALKTLFSYVWFKDARHRPRRDRALSKEFLVFSRVVLVSSTLTLLLSQSDKIVLARLFTLSQFGLYAIALNLASAPQSFADSYIGRVTFPIYSRVFRETPDFLAGTYYKVRRLPSFLYAFACGGLIGGAPLLIAILYDPRYQGAAPYLSLLMIGAALRFPNFSAAEVMTAIGEIKTTLWANVVRLVWLAIAGPIGFFVFGPIGVIGAVGLMEGAAMVYFSVVLRRARLFDLREEAGFLGCIVAGAAIAYAISTTALHLFPHL